MKENNSDQKIFCYFINIVGFAVAGPIEWNNNVVSAWLHVSL